MDELTRAASALREHRELAPTPFPVIERRMKRRRRRNRLVGAAAAAVAVLLAVFGIASATTRSASKPDNVFVGTPSTTVANTTVAPSTASGATQTSTPATHSTEVFTKPARRSNTTPLYAPPVSNYTSGPYDVTSYSFVNAPQQFSNLDSITMTNSALWYTNMAGIVRFDPSVGAVTGRLALVGGEITSTPNTVYGLSSDLVGPHSYSVVAVDASSLATRWSTQLPVASGATPPVLAVGRSVLWVGDPFASQGELLSLDLTTGHVNQTISIPVVPTALVATPTNVFVGGPHSLVRVDLGGASPTVTNFSLAGSFKPYAFDGGGVWGALQTGAYTSDLHLVQLSPTDGKVLHTVSASKSRDVYPTGFAPVGDGTAWITEDPGIVARIDSTSGVVLDQGATHTTMNQGGADIHLFDGVGWAVNAYSDELVRLTHR
jgi:hypothetical protein